jgi:DNA-binding protein HU-beta
MKKSQFIDLVAERAEMSKAAAARVVDAIFDTAGGAISEAVRTAGHLSIPGFGKFSSKTRAAREGRNPRTGTVIQIPERTTVSFSPGKGFKDTMAGSARGGATAAAGATAKSRTAGAARKAAGGATTTAASAAGAAGGATAKKAAAKKSTAAATPATAAAPATATKSTATKSTATKTAATKSAAANTTGSATKSAAKTPAKTGGTKSAKK